jgi:hypothetical protein
LQAKNFCATHIARGFELTVDAQFIFSQFQYVFNALTSSLKAVCRLLYKSVWLRM